MPDIADLLSDAVEDVPVATLDSREIERRATGRRRRRRARWAGAVAAVGCFALAVVLAVLPDDRPEQDAVTQPSTSTTAPPEDPGPSAEQVREFTDALGDRPFFETALFRDIPTSPQDMVDGGMAAPGFVAVGTVEAVGAGDPRLMCLDGLGCMATWTGVVDVSIDRVLAGDEGTTELRVPFTISSGRSTADDQAFAELTVQPYREVAPVGAKVLAFGSAPADAPGEVAASEVFVVAASDDAPALVPHPDPAQRVQPQTFAEYVAEVEALLP